MKYLVFILMTLSFGLSGASLPENPSEDVETQRATIEEYLNSLSPEELVERSRLVKKIERELPLTSSESVLVGLGTTGVLGGGIVAGYLDYLESEWDPKKGSLADKVQNLKYSNSRSYSLIKRTPLVAMGLGLVLFFFVGTQSIPDSLGVDLEGKDADVDVMFEGEEALRAEVREYLSGLSLEKLREIHRSLQEAERLLEEYKKSPSEEN